MRFRRSLPEVAGLCPDMGGAQLHRGLARKARGLPHISRHSRKPFTSSTIEFRRRRKMHLPQPIVLPFVKVDPARPPAFIGTEPWRADDF